MEYPTLEEIFWEFNLNAGTTKDIEEMNNCINSYLTKLEDENKLSDSETDRIAELIGEMNGVCRAAAFRRGFHFAVKLFVEN